MIGLCLKATFLPPKDDLFVSLGKWRHEFILDVPIREALRASPTTRRVFGEASKKFDSSGMQKDAQSKFFGPEGEVNARGSASSNNFVPTRSATSPEGPGGKIFLFYSFASDSWPMIPLTNPPRFTLRLSEGALIFEGGGCHRAPPFVVGLAMGKPFRSSRWLRHLRSRGIELKSRKFPPSGQLGRKLWFLSIPEIAKQAFNASFGLSKQSLMIFQNHPNPSSKFLARQSPLPFGFLSKTTKNKKASHNFWRICWRID